MQHTKHGNAAADTTGWLLGTIIVVLAVLDLLIWATLWNVPNPASKWLTPQAETIGAVRPHSCVWCVACRVALSLTEQRRPPKGRSGIAKNSKDQVPPASGTWAGLAGLMANADSSPARMRFNVASRAFASN